jgi:hypothetical protein
VHIESAREPQQVQGLAIHLREHEVEMDTVAAADGEAALKPAHAKRVGRRGSSEIHVGGMQGRHAVWP